MKKCVIFWGICLLLLAGCSSQETEETRAWTEEQVISLFQESEQHEGWQVEDCVLTPDAAYDCVGVVLAVNPSDSTPYVTFVEADGNSNGCNVDAQLAAEPDLTYDGKGTVRFQLQDEEGAEHLYLVTYSRDSNAVQFAPEGKLP